MRTSEFRRKIGMLGWGQKATAVMLGKSLSSIGRYTSGATIPEVVGLNLEVLILKNKIASL